MKILIIGGVAAGTKTAAKLKREAPDAEVTIITKSADISYAGCGLPYYVSQVIEHRSELFVNTPESFEALTGAKIINETEVTAVDRANKTVTAVSRSGEASTHSYDKLVIAVGASPIVPNCEGVDLENVFYMGSPEDADKLRAAVDSGEIKRAVVVGAGLIGLEVAENLNLRDVKTSVIDIAPQILPNLLDAEMAGYLENVIAGEGIMPFTGVGLEAILGETKVEKVKTSKRAMKADACILALGFRPNTAFLAESGLEMIKGTLVVNEYMQTNDPDIYACGDCAIVTHRVTGARRWSAMGSTANICGRLAARSIAGKNSTPYPGVLSTAVAKMPGINFARTGLGEKEAIECGYDVETVITVSDDKAHYYPGSNPFIIKMIADKATHKLLGLQVFGKGNVDKIVDVAVTAISLGAVLEDLQYCDFAYAPPFSTAIHPFETAVNILLNKLEGEYETITPAQLMRGEHEGYRIVDTSIQPQLKAHPYIELTKVNGEVEGFGKDEKLLLVCNKGKRAYLLQNRLKHYGYTNTRVLEGGTTFNTSLLED
ncbi:MAG: FAD-dependent oxidoreductase [Clostridia bacterium]|nr:FAD-dependent oxidoreductase [Clostridia bacterium]